MNKFYQHQNLGNKLLSGFIPLTRVVKKQIKTVVSIFIYVVVHLITNAAVAATSTSSGVYHSVADSITVKGIVNDSNGSLPGVSVKVKETGKGAATDENGRFSIIAPANGTLVFSFVGFTTQEIAIGGRKSITVTLTEDAKKLNEVVVIGYGTQSREKLIGSVAQVTGEKLASRPVAQLKDALAGQLPGIIVTQRSGRPGVESGAISVRGVGSFGASADPLILVDGILANNFSDIDPNSIESISVLKDASSAAIYGSRAANGVILVTTKTGKIGPPKISLSSYVGTQRATQLPDYINSWEYQQAFFEAVNGAGGGPSTLTADQQATVEKYRAQNDPDYPNIGYLKSVLSKNGFQTGNNLSLNGGSEFNKYNVSLGYLRQNGMVVKNDFSRYNLRLNMNTQLSSKFNLTTGIAAVSTKVNEPFSPGGGIATDMITLIGQAARFPNTFRATYPNGDFGIGLGAGTPISDLSGPSFDLTKHLNLTGNLKLDYRVINDLKLSFISGYRRNDSREKIFRATQRLNATFTTGPSSINETTGTNEYYTLQGLADYSRQFGRNFFSFLGGYSFESYTDNSLGGRRINFPSNDLNVIDVASPDGQTTSGTGSEYALESQFARANYNYAGKYLLEGVVRRDGSSRFPTNNKYAVFPSVAVGWRIGEEKFIKNNAKWISELKLKASWGTLGNQNIGTYPYQNTLNSSANTSYSFGGKILPGFARTQIVDSTLHWESTRTKDIGIEAGLFKNKLTFSATYFDRYTYDILYTPNSSVSNVLGFSLSQVNTGKLQNRGIEFTAGYNGSLHDFSYNINGNLTYLQNKVLDLGVGNIVQPNGMIGNGSSLFIGYPNSNGNYSLYYGYVADGLFVDAQDVIDYQKTASQTAVNPSPKPGDIKYKDISGPNGVPDGKVDATYDRKVLGSQIPKYSYGINLGAKYKGFDFSLLMQGISGVSGRLDAYASYALFNNTGNIQRYQYEGRWTQQNPDPNAIYPRMDQIPGTSSPNTLSSSYWLLNGSYLRIKNLQFGYNLSKSVLKSIGVSSVRIYLSGDNLHTFSNYRQGWDPEVNSNGDFYPIMSTYTLGINVNF